MTDSNGKANTKKLADAEGSSSLPSEDQNVKTTTDNSGDQSVPTCPPPYTPRASPSSGETYIAVLGPTGSGKTTLIGEATGQELEIGHDLESCTKNIQVIETTIGNRIIKFIDTPGFGDTNRSDISILRDLAQSLKQIGPEIRLTAIIYLHKINSNRMQNSDLKTLRVFEQLCGEENYGNIALVTTHWSENKDKRIHEKIRERQLTATDKFWGALLAQGAIVRQHDRGEGSALGIVRELLDRKPVMLKFHRELMSCGFANETSAGRELLRAMMIEREEDQKRISELQSELTRLKLEKEAFETRISKMEEATKAELEELRKKLKKLEQDKEFDQVELNALREKVEGLEECEQALTSQESEAGSQRRPWSCNPQ